MLVKLSIRYIDACAWLVVSTLLATVVSYGTQCTLQKCFLSTWHHGETIHSAWHTVWVLVHSDPQRKLTIAKTLFVLLKLHPTNIQSFWFILFSDHKLACTHYSPCLFLLSFSVLLCSIIGNHPKKILTSIDDMFVKMCANCKKLGKKNLCQN
jgi:hypothetical protein